MFTFEVSALYFDSFMSLSPKNNYEDFFLLACINAWNIVIKHRILNKIKK